MTGFMFWVAVVLGIVEGLTEFLPISSTGHLILVSEWMDFRGKRAEVFQVFIQLGAILAVVWEYRVKLWGVVQDLPRKREARGFAVAEAPDGGSPSTSARMDGSSRTSSAGPLRPTQPLDRRSPSARRVRWSVRRVPRCTALMWTCCGWRRIR